ncbi:hypothetical protein [Plantactinospora sp. B5E13]
MFRTGRKLSRTCGPGAAGLLLGVLLGLLPLPVGTLAIVVTRRRPDRT